ncbi:Phospho-2-dehydro-3-deoxyheptonate aldolase [Quillaja saponaria]|uniref:Phospho-2-dehydro-3-deoxyheptonate aldolase n=1 Tax=Quillaja saponaria TaxID=32244 RepID=A0AAD7L6Y1_QUISA|nr:Phospho-2-dehydro-3-deoxyheptonate aldolase [Quillaja saponaria]
MSSNRSSRPSESFPPIFFASEAQKLEDRLAEAAVGEAFMLQGGDCAESFNEFNGNNIRDTYLNALLIKWTTVSVPSSRGHDHICYLLIFLYHPISKSCLQPFVLGGRMAGQFVKPRSESFEIKNGVKLPLVTKEAKYINGDAFDEKSRRPYPHGLIRAYLQSFGTSKA